MASPEDGKAIVNNGKRFIVALIRIRNRLWPNGGLSPDPSVWAEQGHEFMSQELCRVFTDGPLLDFVYYDAEPGEERTTQIAVQCYVHEQEQNTYQPATLANKASVMTLQYKQCNKDWSLAKKNMLGILEKRRQHCAALASVSQGPSPRSP